MAIAPARRGPGTAALVTAALLAALPASVARALPGRGSTAALQAALRATRAYGGDVDGLYGPRTTVAVRRFQHRAGLPADGIAGRRTRAALGRRGRPSLGRRALRHGAVGWDVAALQFLLARAGFPSGTIDGGLGARTARALRRFQTRAGLPADGVAGPVTLRALAAPSPQCPIRLARPIVAPTGDRFGFRGARLHAGVDFPAPAGTAVTAAAAGTTVSVAYDPGGWGRYVVVDHGGGVRTLYAHLRRALTRAGARVTAGAAIGRVGATGRASGPHLHFEVISRGANVDPLPALR